MILYCSCTGWINQFFACMGGCLGCSTKPTPVIAVDEPSKGLQTPWQTLKIPSASEDFWSTSTHDLEYSALQSHRSLSSISIPPNQSLNHNGGNGSNISHSEFVNHGLLEWNRTRLQWTANKRSDNHGRVRKPKLSWNVNYESLLGSSKHFSRPVPLSEMVEYLVDIWEHEGLYD